LFISQIGFLTLMPKEAKVKYSQLSSKSRSSPHWIKLAAASLIAAAIAGCGGGGTGANTPAGNNATVATATTAAAWQALAPQITINSVTIPATGAGNPVVNFTVTDFVGKPVTGLANYSQASTATVKSLTNLGFTLAKLVPGANNEPSKWVSYNVLRPVTKTEQGGTVAATASCNNVVADATATPAIVAVPPTWCGTFPTTDTQGTLVDNGDGSYQYTFLRDVKQVAANVALLNDTANLLNKKADFGDVGFDATLTHRVGIQLGGAAPGTGNNNPTATTVATNPSVSMVNTANAVFDFRPDGQPVTATRDVVSMASCGSCHQSKVLAHGSRKDPNYCVTCHTDQVKYSFSMEAPATGFVLTGGVTGTTAQKRAEQAVVDGRAIGNFPNYIHKIHMGANLVKTGYNYNANGGAMLFNTVKLPQDVRNCATCHTSPATANAVPSALACGSCHDGINFATGKGATIADKKKDVAAKVAIGTTQSNHPGGVGSVLSDNSKCITCHSAADTALYHGDTAAAAAAPTGSATGVQLPRAPISANNSAALRTTKATISGVVVDANGGVTVNFSVANTVAGVTTPVTTALGTVGFGLVKLVPAANGSSSHWVSYTSRFKTKSDSQAPQLQAYTEASTATGAVLTNNGDGTFSYKFALLNANPATPGDIRTIDHAHNVSTALATLTNAAYIGTGWTGTGATVAGTGVNVVAYEPTLTHRVALTFGTTNAYLDFVPGANGLGTGTVTSARNIVTMTNCATCHNNQKIHAAFETQVCVVCHNSGTADPFTGDTVDLQRLVHKIHMGKTLPSVIAGGSYIVNGAHDYTKAAYPGVIYNCVTCHKETAKGPKGEALANAVNWYTMPTKEACATCHDGAASVAHVDAQTTTAGYQTCVTCHGPNSSLGVDVKTAHSKKLPK